MNTKLEGILAETVVDFHEQRLNCAECVLLTMARYCDWPQALIPRIATPLGGGIGGMQSCCGAFTGALLAIGAAWGRVPGGDKEPAYEEAKALSVFFQQRWGDPVCASLTEVDFSEEAQKELFRAPGGKHETLCEQMVPQICRYLAGRMEALGG